MKLHHLLVAAAAALPFAAPAFGQAQNPDARVSLRLEGRQLQEVVDFLRDESGANIVILDPEAAGDSISLDLTDVPWREALELAGRGRQAEALAERVLEQARALGHEPVLVRSQLRVGAIALDAGQLARAAEPLERAYHRALALRMLDSIEGAVVAVMAEEHLGPAVAERLGRLRIRRADFHILGRASVDDLVALVRRVRARAVLVDSFTATSLLPTDARHLLQRLELDALLGVVQVTKKGQMAGPKEWEHEADAVLYIEDEQWSLQKSRFQPDRPTGNVFPASPP